MIKGKILVTGADGFIGSHLVQELVKNGHEVRAFVYYNSFGSWGWLDSLTKSEKTGFEVTMGDLRDPFGVEKAMDGCSTVLHLGALIGIPYSYNSPLSYVQTNVTGTLNILEAAKKLGVSRVLTTSTSEVYGTALYAPIDESHPKQGQSPYSATKIGADSLADSYFRSFDLPVTIVRPFNTYGPRQSARAFIPSVITQLLAGKKEIRMGSLTPTRDLVYVKDTCRGFIELMTCPGSLGKEVNIATGIEHSIGDVARELIEAISPDARIVEDRSRLRPAKSEVHRLLGSPKLLHSLTGWQPSTPLGKGLSKTIEWFSQKGTMDSYKPDLYNV